MASKHQYHFSTPQIRIASLEMRTEILVPNSKEGDLLVTAARSFSISIKSPD
jgi:hypothetical protein